MIVVSMTDDHALRMLDAERMEGGHDGCVAQVKPGSKARPGVVDERVVARAHDHREALADIEHEHLELCVGQLRTRRPQQR
jgi:hypothetical protein